MKISYHLVKISEHLRISYQLRISYNLLKIIYHLSQLLITCFIMIISYHILLIFLSLIDNKSIRFTETIEPGDKTAVRFTWVFNNDVINKNTAVRFTCFQPWFENSFETFETTSGGSF